VDNPQYSSQAIGVLDTSIASENYGDFLIMDACRRILDDNFPSAHKIFFTSHEKLGIKSYRLQKSVAYNIACGTNLLHSHMSLIKQWHVGIKDVLFLKPVVLLGVGWRSKKSRKTDIYTKWLLKKLLSRDHIHSVRDSYAEEKLKEIGIHNVVNTACPTMWHLDAAHCSQIPAEKGENVVLVLTDYSQSREDDRQLINMLREEYKKIYLWCQGRRDYQYFCSLTDLTGIHVLDANVKPYNELLADPSISVDYVGTRLHAGIRALQYKRRASIIGVDHRALEKGKNFNLPVIDRYSSLERLRGFVREKRATEIFLPEEHIQSWLDQFH